MDETKNCPFCEQLRKVKEDAEYYQKHSPRHRDWWQEYKVSLVTESYCKDVDWCIGTVSYQPTEIKFCPSCGREINKE